MSFPNKQPDQDCRMRRWGLVCGTVVALTLTGGGAGAQQTAHVEIRLEAASTDGGNCEMTFRAMNFTSSDLSELDFLAQAIDISDAVKGLFNFHFAAIPRARQRFAHFTVPQIPCEQIARIEVPLHRASGAINPLLCKGTPDLGDTCRASPKFVSNASIVFQDDGPR